MTEAEFNAKMTERRDGARTLAKAYMRRGSSRWISIALDEGWGRTLEGWMIESCRRVHAQTGALPVFNDLDAFEINANDYEWAKAYGQQFLGAELHEVKAARGARRAA